MGAGDKRHSVQGRVCEGSLTCLHRKRVYGLRKDMEGGGHEGAVG